MTDYKCKECKDTRASSESERIFRERTKTLMTKENENRPGLKWDKIGAAISSLCLVHCLLIPVAVLFLPALSTYLPASEDKTHSILLGLVVVAAAFSFIPGYRVHRHPLPFFISAAGIGLLILSGAFIHDLLGHDREAPISVIGSLLIISAHWVNHSKCKSCTSHSCDQTEEKSSP
jgi:hypothetical protein